MTTSALGAQWRLDDIGAALLPIDTSIATSINSVGQVTGRVGNNTFIWQAGSGHFLPLGSYYSAYGQHQAINDAGYVVGSVTTFVPGGTARAVLWPPGAEPEQVGTLVNPANWGVPVYSMGNGINNAGDVVGAAFYTDGGTHAFLKHGGHMTDLKSLPGLGDSAAFDINAVGWVVGQSTGLSGTNATATLWRDGQIVDLGGQCPIQSCWLTSAAAINDSGQVVGEGSLNNGTTLAYLWRDGVMQNLGTLGGVQASANGINSKGWVVGTSEVQLGDPWHAFLWNGSEMIDLSKLPGVAETGWILQSASDINDAGQIVGRGIFNGRIRAFALTPIPEPATYLLILLGFATVVAVSRKRLKNS